MNFESCSGIALVYFLLWDFSMSIFSSHKKLLDTDVFNQFVDNHSHILPGVDDGVKTMDEALKILSYYEQLGIKRVVLTPHVNVSNNCDKILQTKQFDILLQKYSGPINLHLAAEYMLDAGFERQMDEGLRYVCDRKVLVETSYAAAPNNLYELLYKIALVGDIPLIAHPERYVYMNKNDYFKLKDKGYEFQLNLLSLLGAYGKTVKRNANYLLKNNLYNLIGTDIHSLSSFKNRIDTAKLTRDQINTLISLSKTTKL